LISKGDIIRLFNPSEEGLRKQSHMHIVKDKVDNGSNCKRSFAVCTTSPMRYIKAGVPFLDVEGMPFKEKTYIRLDPIYSVKNVKIKTVSRTRNKHKLNRVKEHDFFDQVTDENEFELNREEFLSLNHLYTKSI
jgi:hypothetical protein